MIEDGVTVSDSSVTPGTTETIALADPQLLTEISDLHKSQVDTNNLLIFLIGLIAGIVFMRSMLKGWLEG